MPARVILSAHSVGIFNVLKKPATAKTVAKKLSLNLRATEIVLDALTSLRLLQKQKNIYKLTATAKKFLCVDSSHYMGHALELFELLWDSWSQLTDILKHGGPAENDRFDHRVFIMAMDDLARWKTTQVLNCIELKKVKKALDLGGGPGTYARALASKGIHVTLFDRPETLPIAEELAKQQNLAKNISFKGGDFLNDPIGSDYDLVLLSQILHAYGPKDCVRLLKKINKALCRDGILLVHEFLVNKNRTAPPSGALFGVNMLVNTHEGRVYPVDEIKEMMKKAGFKKFSICNLHDTVVVKATR